MKNFWTILILLVAGVASAGDAVVTVLDGRGQALANTKCVLTYSTAPAAFGSGVAAVFRDTQTTGTNGSFTITNAAPGNWTVTPSSNNAVKFTFYMPATNGTVRAENFLIAEGSVTYPKNYSLGVSSNEVVTIVEPYIVAFDTNNSFNLESGTVSTKLQTGGTYVSLSTNIYAATTNFAWATNNQRLVIGTVPSYFQGSLSGVTWPGSTNAGPAAPHATPMVQISLDGGTTWLGQTKSTQPVLVSIYFGEQATATNLVIYSYENREAVGRTNDFNGQILFVDMKTGDARQVVNIAGAEAIAEAAVANWWQYPADISSSPLLLSPFWQLAANGANGELTFSFSGQPALRYTPPQYAGTNVYISSFTATETNLQFIVPSAATNAPLIFMTPGLAVPTWVYQTPLTNWASGGYWHIWTAKLTNDTAFFKASTLTNTAQSSKLEVDGVRVALITDLNTNYVTTLTSTNGYFIYTTNATGITATLVLTNVGGFTLPDYVLTNAAAFQPTNNNLTTLATLNGGSLTNLNLANTTGFLPINSLTTNGTSQQGAVLIRDINSVSGRSYSTNPAINLGNATGLTIYFTNITATATNITTNTISSGAVGILDDDRPASSAPDLMIANIGSAVITTGTGYFGFNGTAYYSADYTKIPLPSSIKFTNFIGKLINASTSIGAGTNIAYFVATNGVSTGYGVVLSGPMSAGVTGYFATNTASFTIPAGCNVSLIGTNNFSGTISSMHIGVVAAYTTP